MSLSGITSLKAAFMPRNHHRNNLTKDVYQNIRLVWSRLIEMSIPQKLNIFDTIDIRKMDP